MEIAEFLEQDIQEYLDSLPQPANRGKGIVESAPTAFLTRDYEREFVDALEAGSPVRAKRVLHDLKQKFDEYPQGTPEKQQMKALLMDLYEKFRDHVEAEHAVERMDDALSGRKPLEEQANDPLMPPPPPTQILARKNVVHIERPTTEPARSTPTPPIPTHSTPLLPRAAVPSAPPAQPKPDPHLQDATRQLDDVEAALARGELRAAMRAYRTARRDILSIADVPDLLAGRFVELHARISAAAQEQRRETRSVQGVQSPQHERAPQEPIRPHSLDQGLLLQLEREKRDLDEQLHRADWASAMRTYRRMRVLAQQFSDASMGEEVAGKLVRIYDIINAMRTHPAVNEQRLGKEVP